MKNNLSLLTLIFLLLIITACGNNNTSDENEIAKLEPSSIPTKLTDSAETQTAINTPTPSNTPQPTDTVTPTDTSEPSETPLPTNTITSTNTPEPTETLQPTDTVTPSDTPEPTNTPLPTNTIAPTNTPEPTSNVDWLDGRINGLIADLGFETSAVLYNPNNQVLLLLYRDTLSKGNICSAPFMTDHLSVLFFIEALLDDGYPEIERAILEQVDTDDFLLSRLTWVPSEDQKFYEGPEFYVDECG